MNTKIRQFRLLRIEFQQGLIDNANITTCTNCEYWESKSGCQKWEMMPPPEVLVVGCEEWMFKIPF